jgi:hypothetical protein
MASLRQPTDQPFREQARKRLHDQLDQASLLRLPAAVRPDITATEKRPRTDASNPTKAAADAIRATLDKAMFGAGGMTEATALLLTDRLIPIMGIEQAEQLSTTELTATLREALGILANLFLVSNLHQWPTGTFELQKFDFRAHSINDLVKAIGRCNPGNHLADLTPDIRAAAALFVKNVQQFIADMDNIGGEFGTQIGSSAVKDALLRTVTGERTTAFFHDMQGDVIVNLLKAARGCHRQGPVQRGQEERS